MKIINYYRLLGEWDREKLQRKVNNLIEAGFQPLGGVSIATDSEDDVYYSQAMVTYDED